MKIEPKDGPTINSIAGSSPREIGQSARERAIAKFLESSKNSTQTITSSGESNTVSNAIPVEAPIPEVKVSDPSSIMLEGGQIANSQETSSVNKVDSQSPEVKTSSESKSDEGEPLSQQYALLARKEKALRAKAQAAEAASKAREEALRQKEEALRQKELEYASKYIPKDRIRSDLPSLLAELGLSSEDISNAVYNAPKPEEVALNNRLSSFEAKIKELTDKLESQSKSYEEREKASYDQAVATMHSDIKRLVASDPTFELIKETGSTQLVVDKITEKFDTEGELLDIHDAAMEVENELFERYLKASKLKKIQEKLGIKAEAPKSVTAPAPVQQSQPMKTLTNAVQPTKKLTARERAILAFNYQKQ